MANLTKAERAALQKLLSKQNGKPNQHTANDTLKDFKAFMGKVGISIIEAKPNKYTTKHGEKTGFLTSCSNGKQYQVGQYRTWKLE